jgi:hypothetical protein
MTNQTKKIVGVVVVLGVLYYLYDRNKKMKAKEELVSGADVKPEPSQVPEGTGGTKPTPIVPQTPSVDTQRNFTGSRGNSMFAQYYR